MQSASVLLSTRQKTRQASCLSAHDATRCHTPSCFSVHDATRQPSSMVVIAGAPEGSKLAKRKNWPWAQMAG
jgi:hypothetical protein